jgi:hypothetical protein
LSRNETVSAAWRDQESGCLAGPTPHGTEQAAGSRALVALTPADAQGNAPESHRQAPFLVQLLAIKDQHPQTRERRRAEPD